MNDELHTIYRNLKGALDNANWDAIERATARFADYLLQADNTEAEVWEEKYLDADASRASWRVLALSRADAIAERDQQKTELEQLLAEEREHSTRVYEAADERGNALIGENVRLDLALRASKAEVERLEEDEAVLQQQVNDWRAAHDRARKAVNLWYKRAIDLGWDWDDK